MPDKKSNKKKWIIIVIAVLFIIATIILSLGRDNKNTISVRKGQEIITSEGRVIVPKSSDEIVNFKVAYFNGKKGAWKGTIADLLRILAQAAMDNSKLLYLKEWQ